MTGTIICGNIMKENLTKPPATKYLDMPTEITNMVTCYSWDQQRKALRPEQAEHQSRCWECGCPGSGSLGALAGRKVALSFITTGHTSHRFAFKFTHLYSLGIPNQLNNVRRVPISFYHRGICWSKWKTSLQKQILNLCHTKSLKWEFCEIEAHNQKLHSALGNMTKTPLRTSVKTHNRQCKVLNPRNLKNIR